MFMSSQDKVTSAFSVTHESHITPLHAHRQQALWKRFIRPNGHQCNTKAFWRMRGHSVLKNAVVKCSLLHFSLWPCQFWPLVHTIMECMRVCVCTACVGIWEYVYECVSEPCPKDVVHQLSYHRHRVPSCKRKTMITWLTPSQEITEDPQL